MKTIQLLSATGLAGILLCGCNPEPTAATDTAHKNIITVTKANFEAEVASSSQPVLVDFWAEWCGPCKIIAPIVAELAGEYEGKAKVGKVDIDAETELAKTYNIEAIPTLIVFKDGKPAERIIGVVEKRELKAALEKVISAGTSTSTSVTNQSL